MHIMLDLETWGKTPGSDIRSIGAVVFEPEYGYVAIPTGDSRSFFYVATENPSAHPYHDPDCFLDTESGRYCQYPLTRDPETVAWWNDQSAEAQAAFANPVDLRDACMSFEKWLQSLAWPPEMEASGLRLWANDPHFDVSILDAVYRAVGLPVPWHYRAPRSVRTVCDLAGMTRDDYSKYGTDHHSLDDAIAQAMTVCEAYKRLGLRR